MNIRLILTFMAFSLLSVRGDELSPQEIENCKICKNYIFEGLVEAVTTVGGDSNEGTGSICVASVKVTSSEKGDLKINKPISIYFHHRKGQRPPSPNLVAGKKYKFFIDFAIIKKIKRLYLSDAWLAEEIDVPK